MDGAPQQEVLNNLKEENPESGDITNPEAIDAPIEVSKEITPTKETQEIVERIDSLRQIERKDPKKITQSTGDDHLADDNQQDDPVTSDDDDESISLSYYGYNVPKKVANAVATKIKGSNDSADTWLAIWLKRLMNMK